MEQSREQAFEQVVRTNVGWVYASACRRVRNTAVAEDVTQAVFILLWKRLPQLAGEVRLSGWLFQAVRYCAANALRLERIRRNHEREAAMRMQTTGESVRWSELSEELEAAMDRLASRDRNAILLRFFRGMSLADAGREMGISEDAARMRLQRALEKLRGVLQQRGIASPSAALSSAILANAVPDAPAHLATAIVASSGSAGGSAILAIAAGGAKAFWLAKVKVAAAIAIGASVVVATGAAVANSATGPSIATTRPTTRAAEEPDVQIDVQTRYITLSPELMPQDLYDPATKQFRIDYLDDAQVKNLVRLGQSNIGSSIITAPRVTLFDGGEASVGVSTPRKYRGITATTRPDGTHAYTPAEEETWDGVRQKIAAKATADGKGVRLQFESTLQKILGMEPKETKPERAGDIPVKFEMPQLQTIDLETTTIIPAGKAAILGGQSIQSDDRQDDGAILLILVKPTVIPPAKSPQPQFPLLPPK